MRSGLLKGTIAFFLLFLFGIFAKHHDTVSIFVSAKTTPLKHGDSRFLALPPEVRCHMVAILASKQSKASKAKQASKP